MLSGLAKMGLKEPKNVEDGGSAPVNLRQRRGNVLEKVTLNPSNAR